MSAISFCKFQGTGNDFIIIDNRAGAYNNLTGMEVSKMCNRHFGIGADGLMLLQNKDGYDFEMIYYNADGNIGSMCGNGGRCMVKFAHDIGIVKLNYHFLAIDGAHDATIENDNYIHLKMKDVNNVNLQESFATLDTGSPHYIAFSENIDAIDIVTVGRSIRYSDPFAAEGININFVEKKDDNTIAVRTYERGVENETLSCGTGVTASALVHACQAGQNKIKVITLGGVIQVSFEKVSDTSFNNIFLSGEVCSVFTGIYPL